MAFAAGRGHPRPGERHAPGSRGTQSMNRLIIVAALSLLGTSSAMAQGKVQPDPAKSCGNTTFKPHELCFETPKDEVACAEFLSETFYAIILKTAARCTIPEADRADV